MKFLRFFNINNIVTILACVGVFFIATKIESCSNTKELHRLDKKIAEYEDNRLKDSTTIYTQNKTIFDLQQTVEATKGNDKQLQLIILEKDSQIKALKNAENTCCEELKHLEDTDNIQYYVKDCLSTWYRRVFEKPKKIKE